MDSESRIYRKEGAHLEDYYAYGLPVIAVAAGKVVAVGDGVDDNRVGTIDAVHNWGNYVIIEHAAGFYSCTAHFKKGSVRVKPGQEVKKGEVLASCGNSGRSPYPHIHLQFQYLPQLGAAAIYFEFSNLLLADDSGWVFLPRGIIGEKSVVQNLPVREDFQKFFPYAMNTAWSFGLHEPGKRGTSSVEEWRMDADFYGNTFLVSSPRETKLFFYLSEGVLTVQKMEGSRQSGLFLLGAVLSDLPFLDGDMEVRWTTIEDVDYLVNPLLTRLFDLLVLAGIGLRQRIEHRVMAASDEIEIGTRRHLVLKVPFRMITLKELPPAAVRLERDRGVTLVKAGNRELVSPGPSTL